MKVLRAEHLKKAYQKKVIVKDVSLSLNSGTCVGLLGPNGAGKTTCFYLIAGLQSPDHGHIFLNDRDITRYPIHKRAHLGIGYLPQEASVFRKMTVSQNIMAVLELRNDLNQRKRIEKQELLLEEFHLTHLANSLGLSLSGGERRRIEIARALAIEPDFILLDEPFAGVDPISVLDIKNIIRHLCDNHIGVLITDHNVRETLNICEYAYIVNEGTLLCEGTPNDILQHEKARTLYLGKEFTL